MIELILSVWLAFMATGTIIIMTFMMCRILRDIWKGDF
jgi:hypothetical protein